MVERMKRASIALLLFWVTLAFYSRSADGFVLSKEWVALGAAVFLVGLALFRIPALLRKPLVLLLILFCLWMMGDGLFTAADQTSVWSGSAYLWVILLTFLAVVTSAGRSVKYEKMMHIALAAGVFTAAYGISQTLGADSLNWDTHFERRAFSTLGNPDYLAGYLVALLPLSLILTLRSSGQRAWIGFRAITILLFAGLLMTRVRGSLLALALALVVLVVGLLMPWSRELADKNRKTLLIAFAILILVGGVYSFHELFGSFLLRWVFRDRVYPLAFGIALIVLIVGILIPWGNGLAGKNKKTLLIAFSILVAGGVAFWSRYGGMNTFDLGQASVQQRLQTYKIGMEMVKAHPWTGIGLGQLGRDFPLYQWRPYTEAEWPAHPLTLTEHMHNEYLQFAAEGGLIGLGLFLLVLFAFFRHALKLMDNPAIPSSSKELMLGIAASMTALLGQALTNFPFQVIPTGVLLGFFLAAPLCLEPRPAEPPVTRQENRVLLVVLGLVLLVLGAWGAGNMAASIAFRDTVGETNLGNAANAEKYASRLAVLAPGDPKAWDAVAKARELNKQGDKALEAYDKEISLNPNAVQAYYAMAQEQLLPGHVDEALCTCQKCLSLVPNYSPVLWLEGVCYFKLNRYAEAAGDFEKYVPYAPGEESLYVNLGVCYVKSGRKADAITAWEKAHSLNPNDAQVVLYLKSVGVKI